MKYSTPTEFFNGNMAAYDKALKNGWLKECYEHMPRSGGISERCIYLLWCPLFREVYVGLTYCFETRDHHRKHLKRIRETGHYQRISDYLPVDDACELEDRLIRYFKENTDWICLNKKQGGGLGTISRHTLNAVGV